MDLVCCGVDGIYLMYIIWDYIMFSFSFHIPIQKLVFCLQCGRRGGASKGKPVVLPICLILPAFRAVTLEGLLESIPCFNHFNIHFLCRMIQGGCKKLQVV